MVPLTYVANVTVVVQNPGVSEAGFGVPLLVSHSAAWAERVRTYSEDADVEADFAAGTVERRCAAEMFAQTPRPRSVMIGRAALKPTQKFNVALALAATATAYKLRIACLSAGVWTSQEADFTSVNGVNDDIIAGIKAAVDALAAPALDVTTSTPGAGGSHTLQILSNTAGAYLAVEVLDRNLLSMTENEVDPGIATDLAAIFNASKDWYGLIIPFKSLAIIEAAAAWAESNGRLYITSSADSAIATVADGSATDVAHALKGLSYKYTSLTYHPAQDTFPDAGEIARWFPISPGSDNWRLKVVSGVTPGVYTPTEIVNIEAKNAGFFSTFGGQNVLLGQGKTAGGQFIDVTRSIDQVKAWIEQDLSNLLLQNEKVPYTEAGATQVEATLRAVVRRGVVAGIINPGETGIPAPVVYVPPVSSQTTGDRALRKFNNIAMTFRLAGALNFMQVNLQISA